jgi:hypothetical protein
MKKIFSLLFSLSLTFFLCQKIELKKVTDSSQIFKGEIAGVPITMQLYFAGIPDCSLHQYFVDGWYYYDKYQKKIPLTGIYDYGKLSLFNFGNQQKQSSKNFRGQITSPQKVEKTAEIAEALHPKEKITFEQDDLKGSPILGNFYWNNKTQPAKLFTGNDMIYRYNNYLILPDNKKINTFDFINKYGGNQLVSYISGDNGNRVLLYFDHSSNLNACGMCGASEGEKGYRVLYFTKNWNYKSYEEFLTESCLENIYETKPTKVKDSKILKFNIKKTSSSTSYTLIVDVKNVSVTKSR